MVADDDVPRLDVAMEHAAAVGVVDRVADVDEPPQQLAQLERAAPRVLARDASAWKLLDGLLERISLDEPHGVVGPAVGIGAQAVDRHDPGVLEPAGHLGLEEEPLAAGRVVGMMVEDLLEGDLAVQFGIERHEDGAQAAAGVGPQDVEPLAVGRCGADGVAGDAVGIGVLGPGRAGIDLVERRLDVRVAQLGEALRVDLPAGTAARLLAASPPCDSTCRAARASTADRWAVLRWPRAIR